MPQMIPRPFHALMARLALLAMLLLLAVPTAGRIATSHGETGTSALTALCTIAGLRYVSVEQAPAPLPLPDPAKPQHPGMDCDYCPLLATVVALAVLFVLLPWLFRRESGERILSATRVAAFHPCGLGSRGPPAVLLRA